MWVAHLQRPSQSGDRAHSVDAAQSLEVKAVTSMIGNRQGETEISLEVKAVTSMIGNRQGETEISLDLAEGVLPTGKAFA